MSFQRILEEIWKKDGIESVVFLDSEGETIWSYGCDAPDVLRLAARIRAFSSAASGDSVSVGQHRFAGHRGRWILTHRLKDGYLITVIFSADVNYARTHFTLGEFYEQLEAEL